MYIFYWYLDPPCGLLPFSPPHMLWPWCLYVLKDFFDKEINLQGYFQMFEDERKLDNFTKILGQTFLFLQDPW